MKRNFLSARTLTIALGITFIAGLSACNKFDNDNNPDLQAAGLMAFNLSPDQPALGVALSGNGITNTPLGFNSFTGVYLRIYPGNRTVQSYAFGRDNILASTDQVFLPGKYYSTFFVGADSNYRNVVVQDNFDSLSATNGQAYIRYINAIPDSARPTVQITAGGTSVINENASFAAISEFKAVPAGNVSISIDNGGTINKNRTISLTERKVYTALLIGAPGSANADSIQIRYVENGTLSDDNAAQQRSSNSTRTTPSN